MTALRDALRTGDAKALVASVTWPMFELRLTKVLGPAMLKAYQQAGLDVYGQMGAVVKENPYHDELGRFTSGPGGSWADLDPTYTAPLRKAAPAASLALRFDTQTPGTKKWIERRTAALVKSITEQQREAIRTVIGRVYRAGMGVDDAIPLVRAALGENALFPRWAQAVVNYGMGLQEQGITPARVAEMTDAYYERLADQRAYMIARTEVLAAQNAGRMEGWTQLAEEGIIRVDEVLKEWDASHEGVCEECDALDGTQVGLFDEFPDGPPPLHPSCRCVQNLVRA
jgi:hypothetical protein